MHRFLFWVARFELILICCLTITPLCGRAVTVRSDELTESRAWAETRLKAGSPPFSFVYGGRPSQELLSGWLFKQNARRYEQGAAESHARGKNLTEHVLSWTDPGTGLEVRCVGIEYQDFPTV
ncbi:MAG TPA: hypothetical protein PLW35_14895 [Verrucomicrobiota bacterium]|nr:hypothetical protein [Verrucomicrobiota bacterium]